MSESESTNESGNEMPAGSGGESWEQIAGTVIGMIAAQKTIARDAITPASTFDELKMDSLDKINLAFEVEEHFKISIPDDALNSLRNVADVIAGVQRLQQESNQA